MHVNLRIFPKSVYVFLFMADENSSILPLPGQVLCHVDACNSEGIVDAITLGLADKHDGHLQEGQT